MKEHDVVFKEELKKDLDYLKDKLSFDETRIEHIYEYTIESEEKAVPLMQKVITTIVTIVVALLVGISLMFIMFISNMVNISDIFSFIFYFALLVYIIPGGVFAYLKKTVIGTALSVFGLLIMTVIQGLYYLLSEYSAWSTFILFCIIIIGLYAFYRSRGFKVLLILFFFISLSFFALSLNVRIWEIQLDERLRFMCHICMAVSAVLALTSFFFKKKLNPVINHYYITPLSYNTAFYFYFYFFFLTFIKPQDSSSAVYMVSNIVYFVFVTVTVILFMKYDITVIKHIALIFFSAYIFYKYYDLVWLLLHKSLVLIILGFLFIGAATIAAIRWGVFKKDVQ